MSNRATGLQTVAAILFVCLFAATGRGDRALPVLAEVARDLDVSTAVAGQLRTVAGLVAGMTALALARFGARLALGRSCSPGRSCSRWFAGKRSRARHRPLAAAQVPVGAGIATLTTGGTLAAAEWVSPEHRATTLSWALIGQPAAWIIGMPLLGVAGEQSWRYAWLVLPFVMALLAGAAVAVRGGSATRRATPTIHAALDGARHGPLAARRDCWRTQPGRERSSMRGRCSLSPTGSRAHSPGPCSPSVPPPTYRATSPSDASRPATR